MLLGEMLCDECALRHVEFDLDDYDPDEPLLCEQCAEAELRE